MKFLTAILFCILITSAYASAADATEAQLEQNLMQAIADGGPTRRIDAARAALEQYRTNAVPAAPKPLTPRQAVEKYLTIERGELLRQERISAAKNATLNGVENPYATEKEIAKAARLGTVPKARLLHNSNPSDPFYMTTTETFPPPNTTPTASTLSEAGEIAKANPGKPVTKILQAGGKIIGKVVIVYTAGKFFYDIYSYDGTAFQKTLNAANNLTHIPFTPDFSPLTNFVLQGPEYLKQQRSAALWQKISALTTCLNQWNMQLTYQAYYKKWNVTNPPVPTVTCAPESFFGINTTRTIKNERDADTLRSDLEYYLGLYAKNASA